MLTFKKMVLEEKVDFWVGDGDFQDINEVGYEDDFVITPLVYEEGSALGQNPLNVDYSWLDGYQLQASTMQGNQLINLPSNLSSQYMNNSSTSGFSFPKRQDPTVQFEGDKQKNCEESAVEDDGKAMGMSSAALCSILTLRIEHPSEGRPDLLGERQKDRFSWKDTVDIVVLEQTVFVIELDEHEEYVKTYNFLLTHQLEKECDYQLNLLNFGKEIYQPQDTDEIYTRLDDEQSGRQLLAGRLNMLFRDRRAHARTARLMETEARMSREAWGRSMDASDLAGTEVISLRTTVLAQQLEIRELQSADRRRQTVITEMLAVDRRRQKQLTKELKLIKRLQTQMAEFERQQGPAKGPA
ncbi:hypothetical protein Tco_0604093 [Tanacetum coccineum]